MAKIEFNTLVNEIRGAVDKVVLRKYKGRIILARKAQYEGEPSAAQVAHHKRFQEATDFGKSVLADPAVRPLYEQAADERELPIMAVCVSDYFNAPSVTVLEPMDYTGKAGDPLTITTHDDFGVVRVNVQISDDDQGTLIESGQAVETAPGSGKWVYSATTPVTPGMMVQFQATAFDRPGNSGVQRCAKRI